MKTLFYPGNRVSFIASTSGQTLYGEVTDSNDKYDYVQVLADVDRDSAHRKQWHVLSPNLAMDPQLGDIVRTKKFSQPLEVIKIDRNKQEAGTRPKGNPLPNVTETHPFTELQPYRPESPVKEG